MLSEVCWNVCGVSICQEKSDPVVFNRSWRLSEESVVCRLPLHGYHSIVMITTVIAQAQDRSLRAISPLTLVELAGWRGVILVDLARQIIKLRHGLNLNIVAPNFIPAVVIDVGLDGAVTFFVHECGEVLGLHVNVVHALLAHKLVMSGVAVDLVRHSPIQTVAIILNFNDFQADGSLELLFKVSFFLFILYLLELVSLKSKLSRVKALDEAVVRIGKLQCT